MNLDLKNSRILIVDDQETNLFLLERMLRQAGFQHLKSESDSRRVEQVFQDFSPDLVLLDLHMPHLDGFGVLALIHRLVPASEFLPVIVLTADVTTAVKQKALTSGAKDFLTKPFSTTEVLLRTRNLLETRALQLQLWQQNEDLEMKVRERTREIEDAELELLDRLSSISEHRDDCTGAHTRRVGLVSAMMARKCGLSQYDVDLIRRAAPLHDVGKVAIPDSILLKEGMLTAAEFELMKTHAGAGAEMLANSHFAVIKAAAEIAHTHHEQWDGGGYPRGLKEEEIPLFGRIVSLVDTFDALTHQRPYKAAWSREAAIDELRRLSGVKFDPKLTSIFVELARELPADFFDQPSPALDAISV